MSVRDSDVVAAAAAARALLSKLSARLEITEELRAEIEDVEQQLWDALFPGGASVTKKKR